MRLRLIYILSFILSFAATSKAQTTFPTPEVFFQEDDTIDIYANESVRITNRIESEEVDSIKWEILLSGYAFDYTTGPYNDGSFTFTPPNESTDEIKTYDFKVNVKKMLTDDTKCFLDTTRVFHVRVYPKPSAMVIVRICKGYEDNTGFTAIGVKNKSSQTERLSLNTYATHVLRISIPSVSGDESCWQWSVGDSIRNAGLGNTCKFRYSDEDASEDGTSHVYTIKVRNKLPYRKEAFEDEYELECMVYPVPDANLIQHIETYSGKTVGFGLWYTGGIKGKWSVDWTDYGSDKEYTEEEMNNICKYVDKPTEFKYRMYIINGDENTGYYHGVSYPILKVWKEPRASIYDVNGTRITSRLKAGEAYQAECNEGDDITVSFKVDGGYEADGSWLAFVDSTAESTKKENIVTCTYKINVPDSIRSKATGTTCTYPLYAKIENVYTGEYYSPDSIWYSDSILVDVNVNLCPRKPLKLIKKGNGNSGTVIAYIDNNDPCTRLNGYGLVYGYEDTVDGVATTLNKKDYSANRTHLYDVFPSSILNDKRYKKFVYATIHSASKELVSEKCYLVEDEPEEEVTEVRKYDANGRSAGASTRGMVIIQMSDGSTKKVIKK